MLLDIDGLRSVLAIGTLIPLSPLPLAKCSYSIYHITQHRYSASHCFEFGWKYVIRGDLFSRSLGSKYGGFAIDGVFSRVGI